MARWLTEKSKLEQSDGCNDWYLLNNELFMDDDGNIYLVPRNYKTDNYTVPDWIAWLGGSKSKWDVRPSHIHDFGCQYHQLIKLNVSYVLLMKLGLIKKDNKNKFVCGDIPTKFLSLVPVTKWEIDCLFKRAMKATGIIPARIYNLFRCGVFFNFGWLGKHPAYDLNKIYERQS